MHFLHDCLKCIEGNLVTPLVRDLLSAELQGSTGILTNTNAEAVQITGLLLLNGMRAKLIQSNDDFNLYHLLEVRFFLNQLYLTEDVYIVSEDSWQNAKHKLIERFSNNPNVELCLNMLRDFEAIHPKYKYRSDLEIFIRESRMEDFFHENAETIVVSTIHKAKGREFDNVYLLHDYNPSTDEMNRLLYVALTRAKSNLNIHTSGSYLDTIKSDGFERVEIAKTFPPPPQITIQLGYKDVWLDFFHAVQPLISQLNTGDSLSVSEYSCLNTKGQIVLKFSKRFIQQIETLKQQHYTLKAAKVRYMVYWKPEDSETEIKIILPELLFEGYIKRDESSP